LAVVNACGEDPRCLVTSTGTISILLGKGDGTFETKVDYGTGDFPGVVALADVNADGNLDLVVTNAGSNTVSVLLGKGDGAFGPKADYPTGNGPDWVAVGDFNGDGKLDLAVANYYDATVSVLLGNGDGTFQSRQDYATGRGAGGGTVGDFNGDGKLDLAVPNFDDNTVSVLLGNGDGTFGAKADYVTGSAPVSVSAADLNGDDKPDLVVANNGSDTVSVLFGNGDGTFQTHSDYATGHLPTDVAVGDFNRDGRLDLAVSDSESAVSVLLQAAVVTISPGSLEFGNQLLGTKSAAQKVTVTNNAGVPLNIASIVIRGTDKSDFRQRNNCGSKLPPGAQCAIRVVFAPTETGPLAASLMITDSAPGSPQSVSLSGTGIASGPNVTLSTKNLTFDTQFVGTTSPPQPVRLINYGTETLSISSIVASGDFHQKNDCGSSLPPGKHCTIKVTFTPSGRGQRTGTVLITDNAPDSPQKISLEGAGTVVKFNPAKLNFGAVELGKTKTLSTTLTNTGSTTLDIAGITIKGLPPDDFFQKNTCDGRVGAGKSCTITVTFEPAEKNERSADVSVSDNGGGGQQQVSLSGSGWCFLNKCHIGYCYVDDTTGNLNGSCVSHTVVGFCDIQGSGNCPSGERAIHQSVTTCGSFGTAPIDLARPCSF
jgi:hypothetical protein